MRFWTENPPPGSAVQQSDDCDTAGLREEPVIKGEQTIAITVQYAPIVPQVDGADALHSDAMQKVLSRDRIGGENAVDCNNTNLWAQFMSAVNIIFIQRIGSMLSRVRCGLAYYIQWDYAFMVNYVSKLK